MEAEPILPALISLTNNSGDLISSSAAFTTDGTTPSLPVRLDQGRDAIWYLRVWLFGIGGATVACIGIVCNIITIAVLVNFKTKSSAPFLLSCLAISDSVFLLFQLLQENLTQLAKHGVIDRSYLASAIIQGIYSKMWSVPFVAQTLSIYIVAVITVERYVVVCWPFKAKTLCSLTSARMAMIFTVLFSILINVPHYMAYVGSWKWNNGTQTEKFSFNRTEFGNSVFFIEVFYKWMQMTFNFVIPFIVLMAFNSLSILSIRRHASMVCNTNRRDSETRLTLMIGCMMAIFFVCELMAAIGHVLVSGYANYKDVPDSARRFVAVTDFLLIVNAAANFAIYCVTGRKFRETFRKMFIICKFRKCGYTRAADSSGLGSKNFSSDTKKTMLQSDESL